MTSAFTELKTSTAYNDDMFEYMLRKFTFYINIPVASILDSKIEHIYFKLFSFNNRMTQKK